jgi:hypothetical protein
LLAGISLFHQQEDTAAPPLADQMRQAVGQEAERGHHSTRAGVHATQATIEYGLADSCPALSERSTEEAANSDPMIGESSEGYALWNAFVSGWPKKVRDAPEVRSILI